MFNFRSIPNIKAPVKNTYMSSVGKPVAHFTSTLTLCHELLSRPRTFHIPSTFSGCTLCELSTALHTISNSPLWSFGIGTVASHKVHAHDLYGLWSARTQKMKLFVIIQRIIQEEKFHWNLNLTNGKFIKFKCCLSKDRYKSFNDSLHNRNSKFDDA